MRTDTITMPSRFPAILAGVTVFAASLAAQDLDVTAVPIRVSVMPGYPNAPKTNPEQRHVARPGKKVIVWGNANGGNGTSVGAQYSWSFSANPDLIVTDDGNLRGIVQSDPFIFEEVTFTLLNGSTRTLVDATLVVDDGRGNRDSRTVGIVVVSVKDASSDTPLESQAIDADIAIQNGLRWLYLQHERAATGDVFWTGRHQNFGTVNDTYATTGLAIWALENNGHLASNDPGQDIYADLVRRGTNHLLRGAQVHASPTAPRADTGRGAIANAVSDLNNNGRAVEMCPTEYSGYATPIACAALIASNDGGRVVADLTDSHPLQGRTFREIVEDVVDWIGMGQNKGLDDGFANWQNNGNGRGGWSYMPLNALTRSDMSINGWMYVALEGAEDVFRISVPDWIKQETEYGLVKHQAPATLTERMFGYTNATTVYTGLATTAAGLAGLVLVESEGPFVQPGQLIKDANDTIKAKRDGALAFLGAKWGVRSTSLSNGYGNLGNPYVMWTVARALRMTARSLGVRDRNLELTQGSTRFDWATGELDRSGRLAGPDAPQEGYLQWLVRKQIDDPKQAATSRGQWGATRYNETLTAAMNLLVLTPRVFSEPCRGKVQITDLQPLTGTEFQAGSRVTLSGRAIAAMPEHPIESVLINGEPVDALDANGRFFKSVLVAKGSNPLVIRAFEVCGDTQAEHELVGVEQREIGVDSLVDFSAQIELEYADSTWNRAERAFLADAVAVNRSKLVVDGPLVMVIERFADPSLMAVNPDGHTKSGQPYYVFLKQNDPALAPDQKTAAKKLIFFNPREVKVGYTVGWRTPSNRPPYFTSVPSLLAVTDKPWTYDAKAEDPDVHPLAYSLLAAPSGMAVDAKTGQVSWTPAAVQIGVQSVVLEASDGRGGTARQSFGVEVRSAVANRPPSFKSSPITRAAVGGAYDYQASASDPDSDPVTFEKLAGPQALVVSASGLVHWDFALPGDHAVTIAAKDGRGGLAEQSWTLSAGTQPTNPNAPALYGTPATTAVADGLYVYQPVATDPDTWQTLVFSLPKAPTGMTIDAKTGLVRWTPGKSQVGKHPVELLVDDGFGGKAKQAWEIEVLGIAANRAPVVTSVPPLGAEVGKPYEYLVVAEDPERDPLSFSLVSPPTGMVIGSSGRLTWTPSTSDTVVVAIKVDDGKGLFGSQVYSLRVLPLNQPPTITSSPVASVIAGGTYRYLVNAADPDRDELEFAVLQGPSGMTVHRLGGLVSWPTRPSDIGKHAARVEVADGRGGTDSQGFDVTVTPDTTPPKVDIFLPPGDAAIQKQVLIRISAIDDASVDSLTLTIDSQAVPVDANGWANYTPTKLGNLPVVATARDPSGNSGFGRATLSVIDPDAGPPEITLHSPEPGAVISMPTDIVATIDRQILGGTITWEVRLTREGDTEYKVIGKGTDTVQRAVIATIDASLLANATYEVDIRVTEGLKTRRKFFPISVVGERKLGDFSITVTDLQLPVAGIPMVITRSYSTLETKVGDFGYGWKLGLPGNVMDSAKESPTSTDPYAQEHFTAKTRVYVTRPDGKRVGFTFAPKGGGSIFGWLAVPYFEPDKGVTDKLELTKTTVCLYSGGRFYEIFTPFNPREYRLVTKEGVMYTIDEIDGLKRIQDASGNTLDVTPAGVTSSLGIELAFGRDAQRRIVSITEPNSATMPPGKIHYAYDSIGNLISFKNQLGNETRYYYQDAARPHFLTDVVDPLNRPTICATYDLEGRLQTICDANNQCTRMALDEHAQLQTVHTATGRRIDFVLDQYGNVLFEHRWIDTSIYRTSAYTYDAASNLLTRTDSAGNRWIYTYDARGNLLTQSDPAQRIWTYSYDNSNRRITARDPAGNTAFFFYDTHGNLVAFIDGLGRRIGFGYNSRGLRTSMTDAKQQEWTWEYNVIGLPIRATDPRGKTEHREYDSLGRLIRTVQRNGRIVQYEYNSAHYRIRESWNTNPITDTTLVYDAAGQIVGTTHGNITTRIDYWPTGLPKRDIVRIASVPSPIGVEYGYYDANNSLLPGYDSDGNLTFVTDLSGSITAYSYDELARLASLTQSGRPQAQVNPKRVTFKYGAGDWPLGYDCFADTGNQRLVMSASLAYACGGCNGLLSEANYARGNVSLYRLSWTYDAVGRVATAADADGQHAYTYDAVGRLLSASHSSTNIPNEAYSYDEAGNRTGSHISASYIYDVGNRLLSDDHWTYEYDDNGACTRRRNRATGGSIIFGYDHRGRPTAITSVDAQNTVLSVEQYEYDAFNRRVGVLRNGVQEWTAFDGPNVAYVVNHEGTVVERRFNGRGVDEVVAAEVQGISHWIISDRVGSTRAIVSDSGSVTGTVTWDSFGRPIASSGNFPTQIALYAGRPQCAVAGLVYMRHRVMVSDVGRFLSEDLLVPYDYSYAVSNPISERDPFGLATFLESAQYHAQLVAAYARSYAAMARRWMNTLDPECVKSILNWVVAGGLAGEAVSAATLLAFLPIEVDPTLMGMAVGLWNALSSCK